MRREAVKEYKRKYQAEKHNSFHHETQFEPDEAVKSAERTKEQLRRSYVRKVREQTDYPTTEKDAVVQPFSRGTSAHNPKRREKIAPAQHTTSTAAQPKTEEAINRKLCGADYEENDFIFKWPNGAPFSPDYVSSHFSLLLKNNHLPHIRFHELRHSCASLLLNNGFTLKDVQEYMGHADIQMTANIYGHLDMQRKQLLTEKMASSLF